MSSLYTLATASPKLIQKIERDIKAGERPSVAEIQQQVRADRLVITATPITPRSMPRLHLTAPPEEPNAERHTIAGDDLLAAEADHQAIDFPQQLAGFARYLDDLLAPDVIAAVLPAAKRDTIIADARAIITFLNALNRELWETWSLRVVSDGGDADSTSH